MYQIEYTKSYSKMPRKIIMNMFRKSLAESLTFPQLGLLMIYIGFADWDNRHSKFATTNISNRYLDKLEGLNKDKVSEAKKGLESKGYIEIIKKEGYSDIIRIENPMNYYMDMKELSKEKKKLATLISSEKGNNAKEIFDV